MNFFTKFIYRNLYQRWIGFQLKHFPNAIQAGLTIQQIKVVPCIKCGWHTGFRADNHGLLACNICIEDYGIFRCNNCSRQIYLDLSVPTLKAKTIFCEFCLPDAEHHPDYDKLVTLKDFGRFETMWGYETLRTLSQEIKNYRYNQKIHDFLDTRKGKHISDKEFEKWIEENITDEAYVEEAGVIGRAVSVGNSTSNRLVVPSDDYFDNAYFGKNPFEDSPLLGIQKEFAGNVTFRSNRDFEIPDTESETRKYLIKKDTDILLDFILCRIDTFRRKPESSVIEFAGNKPQNGLTPILLKEIYEICTSNHNCTETERCELFVEFLRQEKLIDSKDEGK